MWLKWVDELMKMACRAVQKTVGENSTIFVGELSARALGPEIINRLTQPHSD